MFRLYDLMAKKKVFIKINAYSICRSSLILQVMFLFNSLRPSDAYMRQ